MTSRVPAMNSQLNAFVNKPFFIFECCDVVMLRNVFRAGVLWDTKVPHCPLFPILVYHRRVSRYYNSRWNLWPVITVCFYPIVLNLVKSYSTSTRTSISLKFFVSRLLQTKSFWQVLSNKINNFEFDCVCNSVM